MNERLEALLLDAGNTVVFLDVEAIAAIVKSAGVEVAPATLRAVEGEAKRSYERALASGGAHEQGWALYFTTLFVATGVDAARARALLDPIGAAHGELNLWRRVPEDLPPALDRARALGLRVGIVSNSEGKLPELFAHVGLGSAFEIVIDSANEGVRKPDPEIFRRALARMGVRAERALYAGDMPSVDVGGARAAGMHAALIDPYDCYPEHTTSPRYPSVAALVDAIALARR